MINEEMRWKIGIILLFVVVFTIAGWALPMVVAAHIPQDQIIEVHEFEAQNATPDATEHYIYFDRTVHIPASADTYTELYMVSETGERFIMNTNHITTYFEEGHRQIIPTMELPRSIGEGTYRYVLVTEFSMADGRIERTFAFESEPFVINESVEMEDDPQKFVNQNT